MKSEEVKNLLEWSGAIMNGHFKLTSGKHSNQYIEKFRLLENPIALDKICSTMADIYIKKEIDLVISAAIGGILLAGGVGRYLNVKHIFSERVDGEMIFKRGFNVKGKSNVVIVEDIITTGGSVKELITLLSKYNANIKGVICIVNRSEENIDFRSPFISLLNLPSQSWKLENLPSWLQKIPITKPGSTGK